MHANKEKIWRRCIPRGCSAVGLKFTSTGDTSDEKHPAILESMEFPEPVINVAEPKTKA